MRGGGGGGGGVGGGRLAELAGWRRRLRGRAARPDTWAARVCWCVCARARGCLPPNAGPIPKHIAFIMDGNRRYARKNNLALKRGHTLGFDKLKETLEWCLDLGVGTVTVYAFSIENFNRSQTEVDTLMDLAKDKFSQLLEKGELIDKHGVCVRVLGDLSLLPHDLQKVIATMVNTSKHNTRCVLNVAFAYTSRHEMTHAVASLAEGVASNRIHPGDVTEELIEECLYTEAATPPDLCVRTSGEVRLSDFLLWQSGFSCVLFRDVLWPEFSFWDLLVCLITFQRNHAAITVRSHALPAPPLPPFQPFCGLPLSLSRARSRSPTPPFSLVRT